MERKFKINKFIPFKTKYKKITYQSNQRPRGLIVEKVEVVAADVEEDGEQGEEHQEKEGGGVVGRADHPHADVRLLEDPPGDGLRGEANPLNVHLLGGADAEAGRLGGPLAEEEKDRRRVEAQGAEDVGALVVVDQAEEKRIAEALTVAPAVGDDGELVGGRAADGALAHRREGGHHDDEGVVAGRLTDALRPDEGAELVRVQADHRLLETEVS